MSKLTVGEVADMRNEIDDTILDMTCSIQRRTQSGTDPAGQPTYTWANIATDQPCHYWQVLDVELIGGQNVTVTRERIVLPANFDVLDNDRVASVKNFDGNEMLGGRMLDIKEVINQLFQTVIMVQDTTSG